MSYYRMRRPAVAAQAYIPFGRSDIRQRVAKRINSRNWALSFVGAVLALNDYATSESYRWERVVRVVDVMGNGKYVKVIRVTDTGEDWGRAQWAHSNHYYRAFDSVKEYVLARKSELVVREYEQKARQLELEKEQALTLLSQNTVTRALVHAHSNDYCSETAVALISAGHKMPDVTLSMRVTLDLEVVLPGNQSYYALRALFGATSGEVEGATGVSAVEHSDKVYEAIREQLSSGEYSLGYSALRHTGTSVTWYAPLLRQVSNNDAYNQIDHNGN